MKSVALHNLGCKVNGYEIDVIQQMLQEKGYKIVSFDENADIYIVNTCTVTNIADRKSRQMLHKAKRKNPDAVVVAAGCYVQTGKEEILKDAGIDLAVGNNKKGDLVKILEEFLQKREKAEKQNISHGEKIKEAVVLEISQVKEYESMQLYRTAEHTRAYIKIQDGCNQFCSYCIIPYARGRVRSREKDDIIREVKGLAQRGYQEIVLTGIHISSFRTKEGGNLLTLIREIHELDGILRIRIGSLEPRIITKDFVEAIHLLPKVCPHFHLSLQSGCDTVLKRMNRRYTAGEYFEKVKLLREVYQLPAITTDVITGFPGETPEEFECTKEFLQKIELYEMHIFKYSRRKGTPAAEMEDQIIETVKTKRSAILLELDKELSERYRSRYIGKEVEILFEEEKVMEEQIYQIGHTPQYIKVAKKTKIKLCNQIGRGIIKGILNEDILLVE